MGPFTVVMLKVEKTTGETAFIASKSYDGLIFPQVGTTATFYNFNLPIEAVKWDITQNLVRVLLEPVRLLDDEIEPFKRDVEKWGGDIED